VNRLAAINVDPVGAINGNAKDATSAFLYKFNVPQ
jgi:hypothetical protein